MGETDEIVISTLIIVLEGTAKLHLHRHNFLQCGAFLVLEKNKTCQKKDFRLRWLIRTYTLGGGVVLDNAMGSGSTGVAAVMEDRKFIGIEMNPEYYTIAENRINEVTK